MSLVFCEPALYLLIASIFPSNISYSLLDILKEACYIEGHRRCIVEAIRDK